MLHKSQIEIDRTYDKSKRTSKQESLQKRLTNAQNFDSLKKFAQKRRNKFEDA